jgi:hypothetical protein
MKVDDDVFELDQGRCDDRISPSSGGGLKASHNMQVEHHLLGTNVSLCQAGITLKIECLSGSFYAAEGHA